MFFILLLSFTGCTYTNKEVPVQMIEYVVEDYYNQYALTSAENYTYSIINSTWDKETNMNTIDICITTEYSYGYIDSKNTLVYQYDRSADTWELIRNNDWEETFRFDVDKINETGFFTSTDAFGDTCECEVTFSEINTEELYAVASYNVYSQREVLSGDDAGTVLNMQVTGTDEALDLYVKNEGITTSDYYSSDSTRKNGEYVNIETYNITFYGDDGKLETKIWFNIEGIYNAFVKIVEESDTLWTME